MSTEMFAETVLMPLLTIELLACTVVIIYSDFRFMIIPNAVNVALLIGGLIFSASQGTTALLIGLVTAIVVFLLVWLIRHVHFRWTGRLGLGMGDVKFIAVASTWLQITLFPVFLFLASSLALVFALASAGSGSAWQRRRIPFGPFLAGSLVLTWAFSLHFLAILGFS